MRLFVLASALALLTAVPLTAAIQPDDQATAERLTLRLTDFDSGWTRDRNSHASTRVRTISCAGMPKIGRAITGFSDSAVFTPADEGDSWADSTSRVFFSVALAQRWFRWDKAGQHAACTGQYYVQSWKRDKRISGVSGQRLRVQSYETLCGENYDRLTAWRFQFTLSWKAYDPEVRVFDFVSVLKGSSVVYFDFQAIDYPFIGGESLVCNVMERG